MRDDKPNLIVDLTFQFSIDLIPFVELLESQKKFVLAKQLLASGTSIGANTREAQNAESKKDLFINLRLRPKKQMKQCIG